MPGVLYVMATPIGNLEDISARAIRILRESDLIFCEDTRVTLKLLNHYSVRKPLHSAHSHNERSRETQLLNALQAGKNVVLVSDAGTPGISDPGNYLVASARRHGHKVTPVPGPSAVLAALSASGLAADGFVFLGFLSRRVGRARREAQEALALEKTVVFFESPFRVKKTIEGLQIPPELTVVVARELSKVYEEFIRGSAAEVLQTLEGREVKGEVVVIIGKEPE